MGDFGWPSGSCLGNLGNVYRKTSPHLALDYYRNALKIYKSIDDNEDIVNSLLSISIVLHFNQEFQALKTTFEELKFYYKKLSDEEKAKLPVEHTEYINNLQNLFN